MSVYWRESPTDAWRRETRRAGVRRAKAILAGALAYAATLMITAGGWCLYLESRIRLSDPMALLSFFVGLLVLFGPPALAARAAYIRIMNSTPPASSAPPPHRPTTF